MPLDYLEAGKLLKLIFPFLRETRSSLLKGQNKKIWSFFDERVDNRGSEGERKSSAAEN